MKKLINIIVICIACTALYSQYRSREDSFFSSAIKEHYHKGFFFGNDFLFKLDDLNDVFRGISFGYTQRKRTKEEEVGIIFDYKGFYSKQINSSPHYIEEKSFLIPLKMCVSIYKNMGDYSRGIGTILPMLGIGLGLVNNNTLILSTTLSRIMRTYRSGAVGSIHIGMEYMIFSPSVGLRLLIDVNGMYTFRGKLNEVVSKALFNTDNNADLEDDDFTFGSSISIGLVAYVF
ncbi:hypothetical protein ACFL6D_01725 [Spirochaetota bacterium]